MNNARKKLISSIENGNLCFFTGAGMSVSPPASLPSGRQIIDAIVDLLLEKSDLRAYLDIDQWGKDILSNIPM